MKNTIIRNIAICIILIVISVSLPSTSHSEQLKYSKLINRKYKNNSNALNSGYVTLDKLRNMIGVDNRYTGKNITVAIIDSGIYSSDDLIKPFNRIIAFKDFVNGSNIPYDDNGHGTAIAGIIGGNGFMSKGVYKGIAPECNIVGIKVLDKYGNADVENVINAINWVCENKTKYNIKILNMSLGIRNNNEMEKPLKDSIDRAINDNILVISSVGNKIDANDMYMPAEFPEVLAVGSIEDVTIEKSNNYKLAYFSDYWNSENGESKPDLLAPGNLILSLQSNVLFNPTQQNDMSMNVSYTISSGTSEAAAVVSGVAAVLMQEYPNENSYLIKNLILDNCIKIKCDTDAQGRGFLYLHTDK